MPRATFMWLLDTSIAFNRFLLTQLNERLGQFIGHGRARPAAAAGRARRALPRGDVQSDALSRASAPSFRSRRRRSATSPASSRQRVNQALKRLEQARLLRVEYGGIHVLDLDGLRGFEG